MNDITALVQRLKAAADGDSYPVLSPDNCKALVETLVEAQAINAAAKKLINCKSNYQSRQSYRELAALLGMNTI